MFKLLSSLFILLLASSAGAFTPAHKECFSITSPVSYNYCVYTPTTLKANGDIAYLLHGRGLSENTWNEEKYYTSMIQQYWESKNIAPPTVVSISFGPIWLLAPKATSPRSGLADLFALSIIPEVEARIGSPRNRILFGESMGGLNSLFLSLQYPTLFKKVASLCPVVYDGSPYDSAAEIDELIKRTGAEPTNVYGAIMLAKEFFANDNDWQKASPLKVLEVIDVKTAPEYYLSCGIYDAYGNFEGSEKFVTRGQARGLSIMWRPLFGGHCVTDVTSVADFLVK